MHPMLNIAVRAARNAGQVVVKAFSQPENIEAIQKGSHDFVTNVDREAEAAIIHTIKKSYPEHSIVAEESGEIAGTNPDYQWIIDPLDGTTNLVKGIPHFAVSIALRVKGKTEQAVVYDPIRDELFTSTRGNGAQLNGYRIRVGKAKELAGNPKVCLHFPWHPLERQVIVYGTATELPVSNVIQYFLSPKIPQIYLRSTTEEDTGGKFFGVKELETITIQYIQ